MDEDIEYEEEEPKEKKKKRRFLFWVVFISIVVAIILIILSITMCRRNTRSNIEVVYEDKGVDAIVQAFVVEQSGTHRSVGELSFDKELTNPQQTISIPSVTLDKVNNYAIFAYYFENFSNTEQMTIGFDDSEIDAENMDVKFLVKYDERLDVSNDGYLNISATSFEIDPLNPQGSSKHSVYVYIKVQIVNPALNSSYAGELYWSLNPVVE